MNKDLKKIQQDIQSRLREITDASALRNFEKKYLGKKGELADFSKNMKNLPLEDRRDIGKEIQEIRKEVESLLSKLRNKFSGDNSQENFFDVTLPGEKIASGHLHPLTLVQRDLERIFSSMGFMILEGPELESDFYNFEALNIPKTHPARDMQDTFYIEGTSDLVMRTHTSNVQVRAMEKYGAPLRAVALGRIFRNEATDASHEHTFHQIEGLMVDKKISLANLAAVLKEMFSGLYEQDVNIRMRPGYFPFVEPGLEVEMSCVFCSGKGCSVCKKTGWVEMLGAGLVHPNVLRAGNIDPDKYQGFAFGTGIERLAMLKYGINDIRLFNAGDLSFLKQF
ncbi:phenylalanine--tRNA ligase subunit alpha [Candidatus Falkowbacteria bacterium CG10_big_fil_rev_8_21_14_0_10_37_6]|uniref:Phenylalanine--tRNA ligase alpha subunit n=1 Tax=Candidatus Falkowbacteria bacterium CG10_big_fil_rev_8_21_14_0_10_37_6 TaxID=1974563 RepID=A0A2H0V7M4_9BACT|nr:MAG: phenylalanine--tRNA ligase subunit alpha [Candidatus Falkowbacteria bacterium CG10_big_fil_rev_8_21_14_0_10_37_6]